MLRQFGKTLPATGQFSLRENKIPRHWPATSNNASVARSAWASSSAIAAGFPETRARQHNRSRAASFSMALASLLPTISGSSRLRGTQKLSWTPHKESLSSRQTSCWHSSWRDSFSRMISCAPCSPAPRRNIGDLQARCRAERCGPDLPRSRRDVSSPARLDSVRRRWRRVLWQ